MEAKQKAIKDHYIKAFIDSGMSEEEAEAKWNEIDPFVDEQGCILITDYDPKNFDGIPIDYMHWNVYSITSLRNIVGNNGWKRIEDGLPEDKSYCWFIDNHGEMYNGTHHAIINEFRRGNKCFGYEEICYWQPITKPNLPLY